MGFPRSNDGRRYLAIATISLIVYILLSPPPIFGIAPWQLTPQPTRDDGFNVHEAVVKHYLSIDDTVLLFHGPEAYIELFFNHTDIDPGGSVRLRALRADRGGLYYLGTDIITSWEGTLDDY